MPTGIIDLSGSIFSTGLPMTWTASPNVAIIYWRLPDDSFAAAYSLISQLRIYITAITVTTTTFVANTLYYWRKGNQCQRNAFCLISHFHSIQAQRLAPGVFDLAR